MPYATGIRTVCLFIQLCTAALKLIVRSWLDVPTFATRRLHVCHHVRAPSEEETVGEKCLIILPKLQFPHHLGIFYML
jgi:hypothetical protein